MKEIPVMHGLMRVRFSVLTLLAIFLVGSLAMESRAGEPKHYWKGVSVGMFQNIKGQQFSYVVGFIDSAVIAYHQGNHWKVKHGAQRSSRYPQTTGGSVYLGGT